MAAAGPQIHEREICCKLISLNVETLHGKDGDKPITYLGKVPALDACKSEGGSASRLKAPGVPVCRTVRGGFLFCRRYIVLAYR